MLAATLRRLGGPHSPIKAPAGAASWLPKRVVGARAAPPGDPQSPKIPRQCPVTHLYLQAVSAANLLIARVTSLRLTTYYLGGPRPLLRIHLFTHIPFARETKHDLRGCASSQSCPRDTSSLRLKTGEKARMRVTLCFDSHNHKTNPISTGTQRICRLCASSAVPTRASSCHRGESRWDAASSSSPGRA